MDIKKPWERRLKDLSQYLANCNTTYFDPDLFRMNINQFLQTARTVTFIIQKNKSNIPEYESWYDTNVLSKWKNDKIMQWAKNSRNVIEKEGDLELFSSLDTTLIFSYLEEEDIKIECGRNELLQFGVKKLIRLARKHLPTGVSDAAVVKIERKWVTSSLSSWELLHALGYIYSRIYECCHHLGQHLNFPIDKSIPNSDTVDSTREQTRKIEFIKLRGENSHYIKTDKVKFNPKFKPPESIKNIIVTNKSSSPHSLKETVQYTSKIAEATFNEYSNHQHMLFFYDDKWQMINMVIPEFDDQSEKFIFWRNIGERIKTKNIFGIIWISESWIRDPKQSHLPIRNMPIIGERLHVFGIDKLNNRENITWNIKRDSTNSVTPTLSKMPDKDSMDFNKAPTYFLVPILRAMGIKDEKIFNTN